MKKTCKIAATMLAVALAITMCCTLVACSNTLEKNSYKNSKLIEERFSKLLTYGAYISGEQIANSNLLPTKADRDAFDEYNNAIPQSKRYYDIYRGQIYMYTDDGIWRLKELLVIVSLADPYNILTLGWIIYPPTDQYPQTICPTPDCTDISNAFALKIGSDKWDRQKLLRETKLNAEGKECGGIVMTLEPNPEKENFWMQVFTMEYEEQTYTLTEKQIVELKAAYA